MSAEPVEIVLPDQKAVSGLLQVPSGAKACTVLAHGAGAGMTHGFLEAISAELAERRIATLRFQFPFMERGSKRPDPAPVAQETVRAAAATAAGKMPQLPLIVAGRSFGGRMASQAQARSALTGVRGLVFLGFPLHPAKKPSVERAQHLADINLPMLFVQGTRDALAEQTLLREVVEQLGPRANLNLIEGADHSFHVPARSGRTDAEVRREIADVVSGWIDQVIPVPPAG